MEYHDQPLQFISNYYFQAKDEDHANHRTLSFIMIAVAYLPLVLIPIISHLTITYIYPVLLYSLKRCSDYVFQNIKDSSKVSAYNSGLIFSTIVINIKIILYHICSFITLNQYSNEVLHDSYETIVYVGTVLSAFATVTVYATAVGISVWKWKCINVIATYISAIIIHMGYFFPVMLLAFMQDPLIITFYYFVLIFILIFFLLYWVKLSKVYAILRNRYGAIKAYILFYSVTTVLAIIFDVCTTLLISGMFSLGGFSDSQALQTLILSLLIGLLSFFIFKPAYKEACRHVKLNKVVNVEEENETSLSTIGFSSNIFISDKATDENQKEEEVDTNDQNNKHTTV